MKKNTAENPFLAYANYPLKGNPRNLHKIFDSIEHYYTVPERDCAYIRRIVDTIIELSDYNDPGVITKYSPPPVIDNANASKVEEVFETLDNIVPNWEAINKDPEFLRWLDEVDPLNGVKRQTLLDDAFANFDAARVARFFTLYPGKGGVRTSGASSEDSAFDKRDIQRDAPIEQLDIVSYPENQIILPQQVPVPGREVSSHDESILPIAVEAVYGYMEGFCESTCRLRGLMIEELGQDVFSGSDRPKCYECYQTKFVRMLSMVTKRQPYSEEFLFFLNNSSKYVKRVLQPASVTDDGLLEEVVFFVPEDPLFYGAIKGGPYEIYKEVFHNHLYGLIAGSLAEYLLKKDKQGRPNQIRLKRCPDCNNFYIGRINQVYCSRECFERHYHRDYMREKRDEKSPKYDERYKTREFG